MEIWPLQDWRKGNNRYVAAFPAITGHSLTISTVRLESGGLAVFSPVALTEDVKRKVSEMGEVKYIAALDNEVRLPPFPELRIA